MFVSGFFFIVVFICVFMFFSFWKCVFWGLHWCHMTCGFKHTVRPSVCLTGSSDVPVCVFGPWVVSVRRLPLLLCVFMTDVSQWTAVSLFFFSTFSSLTRLLSLFFVAFQEDSERYSRHSRRHASVCICPSFIFLYVLLTFPVSSLLMILCCNDVIDDDNWWQMRIF